MRQATLHPRLRLRDATAQRAPAYVRADEQTGVLGNGLIELRIDFRQEGNKLGIVANKLTGEEIQLRFSPFEVYFDTGKANTSGAAFTNFETRGSADVACLATHASFDWFDIELAYSVHRGHHFFQKSIVFHDLKKRATLQRVCLFRPQVPEDCDVLLHDAGMYFPVAFVRGKKGGIFYCGDFAGYNASLEGHSFTLDYCPGEALEPGRSFQALAVDLGVYTLTGRRRANVYHESGAELDLGERQWFHEYLQLGCGASELPFWELKGPDEDILGVSEFELLDQCKWLGVRHVLVPRMLASLDAYPFVEAFKTRMRKEGIRAALVIAREKSPNLSWVALAQNGGPASPDFGPCYACEEFRDSLVDRYIELMDEHRFVDVEVRGAPIVACYSAGHGHAIGPESIQKAFEGLVETSEALRESFGHVRCGRPYGSYGAGLARLFDSVPPLVEEHPLPLPDLHVARLFADMGRLYFRRSHDFLLPKCRLGNAVGVVPEASPDAPYPGTEHYPWYLYHDADGWRYSLISAIATGLRHRFHAIPTNLSPEDRAFAKKWLQWEKEHLNELLDVEEILDEPGLGAVDGYSYTSERGALVFLFNNTYDPQEARLKLNLSHDSGYVLRELYPREFNYLGPNDGLFRRDGVLAVALEPREARVIEAVRRSPASTKRKRPEVFGACAKKDEDGKVTLAGVPGSRCQVGIRAQGKFSKRQIQFPGTTCPDRIEAWSFRQEPLRHGTSLSLQNGFSDAPWSQTVQVDRNIWLSADYSIPEVYREHVDTSPFTLHRPCWTYPERLFFVIRVEPPAAFDPIRTSSRVPGIPEGYMTSSPIKCGIDLTSLNLGLKAWVNGCEQEVYPAIAAWDGFSPNPYPVVAYFFEAGSQLEFGESNRIVLFARHIDAIAFRGIFIEHLPRLEAEKVLEI